MKRILLLGLLFIAVSVTYAQSEVTGKIVSADDGSPMPFVTVMVKETATMTSSDVNGHYKITVPSNDAILVFTFMGYLTEEVAVNSRAVVNVEMMSEAQGLDEAVVTALGISREKKALGYAMQEVKGDEMLKARQSNAVSMLSGKVAGLQITSAGGAIGGSSRVVMRGVKSVLGNNQPLYVIDGIPIDNSDFNTTATSQGGAGKDFGNMSQDINPDDIESVSVLKGASASALYGSRAANGVILITTKKGAKGKGVEVSLTSGVSLENMLERNLPKMQKLYGGGGGNRTDFDKVNINGKEYSVPAYAIDESWGPRLDGRPVLQWEGLYPDDPENYLKETPWVYPKNDIMYYFKTGLVFDNNVSVTGGGENTMFRVSYTNKTADGIIPNSSLQRNTLSGTGSVTWDKLTVSSSLNYVSNYVNGRPWTGTTNRNVINQAYQWGMVQVDYKHMENYKRPDGSQRLWNVTAWNNLTPKYIDNPYWGAYMSYAEEQRDRMYGNVGAVYAFTDWLSASVKVNGDYYAYGMEDRIAVYSRSTSEYAESVTRFREMNYEAMLSANHRFGDFSINGFVGGNIMTRDRKFNESRTQGGLFIPEYYNLSNAASVLTTDNTYKKQINSLFASASFGWKSLLYLDATFRGDWSSTLPSGARDYYYPSVTSSFVFSEIAGLNEISWLNFGKLRAGWAKVGNDTDPYVLEKAYYLLGNSFAGIPNYELRTSFHNAGLKPELTNSLELGLELRMLNNRLGLDATFYNNTSQDQIMNIDIPTSSGYSKAWKNAGKILNRGVELSVSGTPVKLKNFDWNLAVNWSKNKNEVKELYGDIQSLRVASSFVDLYAAVGQPYGMLTGSNYVYDQNGNKVVTATGVYAKTEQPEYLGSVLPDWMMGIRSDVRFKNFTFGFLIDIRQGGKFFSQTYKTGMYSGTLEESAANGVRENGKTLEGVRGDIKFNSDGTYAVTNTRANDVWVNGYDWARSIYTGPAAQNIFDASYVKLRELNLGYTFNTAKWDLVKSLRISAFAYNVWTIYKANKHIDPDFTTSSSNVQGIEGAVVPAPITYGLSVNVKF